MVGHLELEVLGGDQIDHVHGLFGRLADHGVAGRLQGGRDLPGPVGGSGQAGHLGRYRLGRLLLPGHQPGQPVGAVLGLQDHVDGGQLGVGGGVGHHHHLRRAGEGRGHPDRPGHLPHGQGHVDVAGPGDDVDGGDRLGAVGQGRHRLGPPDRVDPVHPGHGRRGQHHVGDCPVGAGRHGQGDVVHLGHPGRHRGHDHRGRVDGPAPRRVAAGPAHRPQPGFHREPRGQEHGRGGQLAGLVVRHVGRRRLQGLQHSLGDPIERGRDRFVAHGQGLELHAVEAPGQLDQGPVAAGSDLLDDGPDLLDGSGGGRAGTGKERVQRPGPTAEIQAAEHPVTLPARRSAVRVRGRWRGRSR